MASPLVRNAVKLGLVGLVVFMPAIAAPVLLGVAAVSLYNRARLNREMRRQAEQEGGAVRTPTRRERREEERRKERALREEAVEYDQSRGWNFALLPVDMEADISGADRFSAKFTCAGIRDLVYGRADSRGNVRYDFLFTDREKAQELQRKARMYNGAVSVRPTRDGRAFEVTASNAAAINEMAKAAFPSVKQEVERTIVKSQYYTVSGCKDYADAVKKFEATRASRVPDKTVLGVTDTVGGERFDRVVPEEYSPTYLEVGQYVVRVDTETKYRGEVNVPGNVSSTEEVREYASRNYVPKPTEEVSGRSASEKLSDATSKEATRYVSDGTTVLDIRTADDPRYRTMRTYLVCEDMDSLAEILNGGEIPKDALLVMDRYLPDRVDGKFVLELDAADDIRSKLAVQGDASPAFVAKCESMGVGRDTVEVSRIMEEVSERGYATVRLRDGVSLERVKINGVPVEEVAARMENKRLVELDREGLGRWIADAGKIQAMNITVDAKRAELRITSVVDDVQKVETRKLTPRDVEQFSRRGEISKAEMKDVLMQVHPDFFRSYRVDGKPMFEDPVRDFIAGRKPAANPSLREQMRQAQNRTPEKTVVEVKRKPKGPRL
jgi:hypothetical protein